VEAALQSLAKQSLGPEFAWQREYLRCRLWLDEGQANAARQDATNLVALAAASEQPQLHTEEAVAFWAGILERLNRLDEAISVYERNFAEGVSANRQRQTLLKVADLYQAQGNISNAVQTLENFLAQSTNASAADAALLALGELQLKQCLARETNSPADATNFLTQASAQFERLLNTFTNSPLAGKAYLDRGWCEWEAAKLAGDLGDSKTAAQKTAESLADFQTAAKLLPPSEDQAVARFKWADAQFMLTNYTGAISNYDFVVTNYASLPEAREQLIEQALYQTVRAALDAGDLNSATNALAKILDWYPNGLAGDSCLLLAGEGFAQRQDPVRARELFDDFERRYPDSPLLPKARLAEARAFE